jgi:hypothetical protein
LHPLVVKNAPHDAHAIAPGTDRDPVEQGTVQVYPRENGRMPFGFIPVDDVNHVLPDKYFLQAENIQALVDLLPVQVQVHIETVLGNQDAEAVRELAGVEISFALFRAEIEGVSPEITTQLFGEVA